MPGVANASSARGAADNRPSARDVVRVVGPSDHRECGLPARDRNVADVPGTDNDPGTGQDPCDQSQEMYVVGHLVDHACGRGRCPGLQLIKIPSSRDFRRSRTEGIQRGERIASGPADDLGQTMEHELHVRQLARAMDLGVGCEDLFGQGRSRPRQADDEDGTPIRVAPLVACCDKIWREGGDDPVDEERMFVGVVGPAPCRPVGGLPRVGDLKQGGGLRVRAPIFENCGQKEMQSSPVANVQRFLLRIRCITLNSGLGNLPRRILASRQ